MVLVRHVLEILQAIAPERFAASWDRIGLQVGEADAPVTKALVSLDRSLASVQAAAELGANLLISHHPLIFSPITSIDSRRHDTRTILALIRNQIHFIAAHTNWDAAQGGINDALANTLGLVNVRSFGSAEPVKRHMVAFTVPKDDADAVIDAVAAIGGGTIGPYRRCAFSVSGNGTFEPLSGAHPSIGTIGERQNVDEVRVEMTIMAELQSKALAAIQRAHPYENPYVQFLPVEPEFEQAYGRIGNLENPLTYREWVDRVDHRLQTRSWAWGAPDQTIRTVAVVGGAADGEWKAALNAGADVLVTGEVKQHVALEASECGLAIMASGHYATEQPGVEALCELLAVRLPEVDFSVYSPPKGLAGRPQ